MVVFRFYPEKREQSIYKHWSSVHLQHYNAMSQWTQNKGSGSYTTYNIQCRVTSEHQIT